MMTEAPDIIYDSPDDVDSRVATRERLENHPAEVKGFSSRWMACSWMLPTDVKS